MLQGIGALVDTQTFACDVSEILIKKFAPVHVGRCCVRPVKTVPSGSFFLRPVFVDVSADAVRMVVSQIIPDACVERGVSVSSVFVSQLSESVTTCFMDGCPSALLVVVVAQSSIGYRICVSIIASVCPYHIACARVTMYICHYHYQGLVCSYTYFLLIIAFSASFSAFCSQSLHRVFKSRVIVSSDSGRSRSELCAEYSRG